MKSISLSNENSDTLTFSIKLVEQGDVNIISGSLFLKDVHQGHAPRLTPCKLVDQLVLVELGHQLPVALHQS